MIMQSIRRHSIAIGLVLAVAALAAFAQATGAQTAAGGTTGAPASQLSPQQQAQQQAAEFLLSSLGPGEAARYPDVMEAITRASNGDGAGAQALLEKAAKNNRSLPPSEVMLARLLLKLGQPAPALAQLEKAVVAHPKDPEAYLLFAEGALQDGHIAYAAALLEQAKPLIAAYNDSPKRKTFFESRLAQYLTFAAVARAAAGSTDEWTTAVDRAKEWVKAEPDSAQAHQHLARAIFKQMATNDYATKALNELRTAAEKDKNAMQPYIFLAQLYQEAGKDDDAKTSIGYALQQSPKDLNVNLQAANWALNTSTPQNKRLDDAEKYADAAMRIDPKSLDAKALRAGIARLKGDLPTAEKLLREVVIDSPSHVGANNQLALVLVEQNNEDKKKQARQYAEDNVRRTTQGNQFNAEAIATLAWVLYNTGDKDRASQILQQVLQTRQLTPDMAFYVAKMWQEQGKIDDAIRLLEPIEKATAPFAQREATKKLLADLRAEKAKENGPANDQKKDSKGTEPTSSSR